jgi:hypothetical protein
VGRAGAGRGTGGICPASKNGFGLPEPPGCTPYQPVGCWGACSRSPSRSASAGMSSCPAGAKCGNAGTTGLGEVLTPSWPPTSSDSVVRTQVGKERSDHCRSVLHRVGGTTQFCYLRRGPPHGLAERCDIAGRRAGVERLGVRARLREEQRPQHRIGRAADLPLGTVPGQADPCPHGDVGAAERGGSRASSVAPSCVMQ